MAMYDAAQTLLLPLANIQHCASIRLHCVGCG
jgi:hypothetical protein